MSLGFVSAQALREGRVLARRGGLAVACLALGIAAVVTVGGLADGVEDALRAQARELLGGDVAVSGPERPPQEVTDALAAIPGARMVVVTQVMSMASSRRSEAEDSAATTLGAAATTLGPAATTLVAIKAVGAGWPLVGAAVTEPAGVVSSLDDASVLAAREVLTRLKIATGDEMRLGEAGFRVAGTIGTEPDRLGVAFAPRVLMTTGGLARTKLMDSRTREDTSVRLVLPAQSSARAITDAAGAATAALGDKAPFFEVEDSTRPRRELAEEVSRARRFLGLVALLSLLASGVGIAQVVSAWVASRTDAIAVLRCLGASTAEILATQGLLISALGVAGALAGGALGTVMVTLLPALAPDAFGRLVPGAWHPVVLVEGVLLGVVVAVAASLPALLELSRVPPLRALRRSVEPGLARRWPRVAVGLVLLALVFGVAALQVRSARLGGAVTGVLLATGVLLWGASALAGRLLRRLPHVSPAWLRHGLLWAAEPGRTGAAVVSLGLGVVIVVALSLVQHALREQLSGELPATAPSVFLVDIQPDQWPAVEHALELSGARSIRSVPMAVGRLASVDGKPVGELADAKGRERWALTREQRLTWSASLPEGNSLVEGSLWSDPGRAETSLDEDFARDLGVHVGSTIVLDVQGIPVDLAVTSLRRVDWKTFGINFFILVEPGVLEEAPQQVLASARLEPGREEEATTAVVAGAPNVTVVPLRDVLDRIALIVRRIAVGVGVLGLTAVVAAAAVLASASAAEAGRRSRELALLRALGMTRMEAMGLPLTEHAVLGAIAGLLGAGGGTLAAWIAVRWGLDLHWSVAPALIVGPALGTVALALVAGLAAVVQAVRAKPIEALRSE